MKNSPLQTSILIGLLAFAIGFTAFVVIPTMLMDASIVIVLLYIYLFVLGPIIGFTFGRIKYKELKDESANPIQNKSTVKTRVRLVDVSDDSIVTINGQTYIGNSVTINNGKVTVNGNDVTPDSKTITISINGNINDLKVDRCVSIDVEGDVGNLKTTSGNVNVTGNVTDSIKLTSGDIKCNDVGGSIKTTSGKIDCHTIHGNAKSVHGKVTTQKSISRQLDDLLKQS
jgi:hypothetical protein